MGEYLSRVVELLTRIEAEEANALSSASDAVAEAICRDGLVHVFGCGHSTSPRWMRSTARVGLPASRRSWTRT